MLVLTGTLWVASALVELVSLGWRYGLYSSPLFVLSLATIGTDKNMLCDSQNNLVDTTALGVVHYAAVGLWGCSEVYGMVMRGTSLWVVAAHTALALGWATFYFVGAYANACDLATMRLSGGLESLLVCSVRLMWRGARQGPAPRDGGVDHLKRILRS